jgi:glutamate-1-semialdehyde aminotransferase
MEVQRDREANVYFLEQVRKIADEVNAVLIFDEVSSGFRLSVGGVHKLYGVEPDMLVLGKALGNGYPISAILGKRDVMEAAQDTFISSTYWTERIGFVAALETITQFEKNNVAEYLADMGNYIDMGLKDIFEDLEMPIELGGMICIPKLKIADKASLLIKSVFTKEMLERGFLASNLIFLSFCHTKDIIDRYLFSAHEVFKKIKLAMELGNLNELLDGPICHSGFKRLT